MKDESANERGERILTDTRTAGVGKDQASELLKGLQLAVSLNSRSNLLGTGSDGEERFGLDTVGHGILGNGSGAAHILIRGIRARTDKADLELFWPLIGLDSLLELADGCSKIGSEGTVDVGLELREVELDKLVVLCTLVLVELRGVLASEVADRLPLSGLEIVVHAVVEGEQGGGGTDLGTAKVAVSRRLRLKRKVHSSKSQAIIR